MIPKLKRCPGLYLVGFMGCGKTTVGIRLADELGWEFADLDDEIERKAGMSIREIFTSQGEEAFRRLEHETLKERLARIRRGEPTVLALGGGAFAVPQNYELLADEGVSIWLDCPFEILAGRVAGDPARPLAQDPERFRQLYEQRRQAYARADFRIDTTGKTPEAIVQEILNLPIF